MRILSVKGPGELEYLEGNSPEPSEGQVVVRVNACGICGTDLGIYRRGETEYPYFGHEFSGIVERIGCDVKDLQVGDRVTTGLMGSCGSCKPCQLGHPNFCQEMKDTLYPGGFAEECLVRHSRGCILLTRIPDGMDDITATLHEPLSCALRIVQRASPGSGDTVLIYGLGTMGVLSGILSKRSYSVKTLIGVDINASRVKRAEKLGFDFVSCVDLTRIEEFIRVVGEPDIVIDATGMSAAFPRVMGVARLGGKIVIAGVPEDFVELSLLPIFRKELTVLGAKGPFPYLSPNGGSIVLELLGTGDLPVHDLVGVFSFDKAREAFHAVSDGTVLKGVLAF